MKRPRKRRAESGKRWVRSRQTRTVWHARAGRVGSARRTDSETSRFVPGRPIQDCGNTRSRVETHGRGNPSNGVGASELRREPQWSNGATRWAKLSSDGSSRVFGCDPGRQWKLAEASGVGSRNRNGRLRPERWCTEARSASRGYCCSSRESLEWNTLPPGSGRVGPRGRCERIRTGKRENNPMDVSG